MSKTPLAQTYTPAYAPVMQICDRDALVEAHLAQVKFIVDRIAARLPRSVDRDDLIGAGLLGLLDAAAKFDPSRGVQFKTYAELRVRGAVLDSLRMLDCAPRSARQRAKEVEAAYLHIERTHGRPATEQEVADFLGVPLHDFQIELGELRWLTVASIDEEDADGTTAIAQRIPGDSSLIPSIVYERTEQRERLSAAVDRLPERERQVIALYYVEELTMKEVGAVLGVSESRVCQIHTQAVLHLRAALGPLKGAGRTSQGIH